MVYVARSQVSSNNASIGRLTVTGDLDLLATPTLLTVHRRASWSDFVFDVVDVFESSGFVYALTVQREFPSSRGSTLVTRLVRLCAGDASFHSYTELTLQCRQLTTGAVTRQATAARLAPQVTLHDPSVTRYISRESKTTRNVLWSRASVCVCVCLSVCPRPHAYSIARTRM